MKLWIGTWTSEVIPNFSVRCAATSDAKLRAKMSDVALIGMDAPGEKDPVRLAGAWKVTHVDVATDADGACALIDGGLNAKSEGETFTYHVNADGKVRKVER